MTRCEYRICNTMDTSLTSAKINEPVSAPDSARVVGDALDTNPR